ncbi:MAG: T9SS type A sorting domain-containing protein, partial [Bacteroidota bacterium]
LSYHLPKTQSGTSVQAVLYDVSGRKIRTLLYDYPSGSGQQTHLLELQNLHTGVYVVQVRIGAAVRLLPILIMENK